MHDVLPMEVSNMKCKLHSILKSYVVCNVKYIVLNVASANSGKLVEILLVSVVMKL